MMQSSMAQGKTRYVLILLAYPLTSALCSGKLALILASLQGIYSPQITKPSIQSILSHSLLSPAATSATGESLASARSSATPLPTPFQGLDLLLLHVPPPSLSILSPGFAKSGITSSEGAEPLVEVVKKSRPRYMFWSEGDGYWEREPFAWESSAGKEERWTRGVKLGALGGEAGPDGKKARVRRCFLRDSHVVEEYSGRVELNDGGSGSTLSHSPHKPLQRLSRPDRQMRRQIPTWSHWRRGRSVQRWKIRMRRLVEEKSSGEGPVSFLLRLETSS